MKKVDDNYMEYIETIAENTTIIASSLSGSEPFWNTQWFSALIGAVSALFITYLKDIFAKRNKSLNDFYDYLATDGHWCSLDSIGQQAGMTMYGHKQTKRGVTTTIPEKDFSEKVSIELRKRCKYWRLPLSQIRFMFQRYENLLKKIPNNKNYHDSEEYKKADLYFKKIMDFIYKKTGENMWTAR